MSHPTVSSALASFYDDIADYLETYADQATPPDTWEEWLRAMFPKSVTADFGDHHRKFWEWVWTMPASRTAQYLSAGEEGVEERAVQDSSVSVRSSRPRPFIAVWPRGGAKTSSGELGIVAVGARGVRKYAVIISSTQSQANDKVANVAAKLESGSVEEFYPAMGERAVSKFGTAKGWRRDRLHTASGFIVDGLGMDVAMRGLKVEDKRPDLLVFDDLDLEDDSEAMTDRKIRTITSTILPMGTSDVAVLGLQNLIIPNGVFSRIVKNKVDFLVDRIVSGPIPSVVGFEYEIVEQKDGTPRAILTKGEPTWVGQDRVACQNELDTYGLASFLRENQHQVDEVPDALWTREMIETHRIHLGSEEHKKLPAFEAVVVGVDPQGTKKKGSETGIVVVAYGKNGHVYVLDDASINGSPEEWGSKAIWAFDFHKADEVVGEVNFGADMVEHNLRVIRNNVPFREVRATRGKDKRAQPVVSLYERGLVHHVGTFPKLETEMVTWSNGCGWSPNRLDSLVWATFAVVPDLVGEVKTSVGYARMKM